MLSAVQISKFYGNVRALFNVDLNVDSGEVVALAGENGSGKSTLARILAGADEPDAGSVMIDGRPVRFARPRMALEAGVAIVTQEVTAVPELSVAENVLLPRANSPWRWHRPAAVTEQARSLLTRTGLRANARTPFRQLPPGDAVLAEVARALSSNPRTVILDEVTTRIGGPDVERLFELLRSLRDDGMGIVFITHRLAEIRDLADRTVVLRDGCVMGEMARHAASEAKISSMMVGRELDEFERATAQAAGTPRLDVRSLAVEGLRQTVALTVRAGEIVGLAGLVGSGRTEVLETVAGVRGSAGGELLVDGVPVPTGSVAAARQAGIGFVPEDRHRQGLLLQAALRTNVSLGTWRLHRVARRAEERVAALRCITDLRIKVPGTETPVAELSGGNQQKVVIGRTLLSRPKVLILDEPTRGIDIGARAEIFHLIDELARTGVAVLLASSDLREVLALCDRVLVLHDRGFAGELTSDEASEERIALLAGGGQ